MYGAGLRKDHDTVAHGTMNGHVTAIENLNLLHGQESLARSAEQTSRVNAAEAKLSEERKRFQRFREDAKRKLEEEAVCSQTSCSWQSALAWKRASHGERQRRWPVQRHRYRFS